MHNHTEHFHFIGIGGIGMSGIAKILLQQGYTVSGCDKNMHQKSITDLQKLGCRISEHNEATCYDTSITYRIYSTDIPKNLTELHYAQEHSFPIIHRSLILNELMKQKYSIAVAGSHGKTTTTSLITHIFQYAQLDPSFVIGGFLKNVDTNAHHGSGKYIIVETDESDRSLLHLSPTHAILTSIDLEHMNVYHNAHDITSTFNTFLSRLPFYGKAIVCADDSSIQSLLPLSNTTAITYGFSKKALWNIHSMILDKISSTYQLTNTQTQQTITVSVSIPGEHNILNSAAALILAQELHIPLQTILDALRCFQGVDRRFSYRGIYQGKEIFDDYGHHPTEIAYTLQNAFRYAGSNPVTVVFQPHRYTRTKSLWNEFITLFASSPIDHLIITDIYAAHEQPEPTISSQKMVAAIKEKNPHCTISYIPYEADYSSLKTCIDRYTAQSGILLIQGAGPITGIKNILI